MQEGVLPQSLYLIYTCSGCHHQASQWYVRCNMRGAPSAACQRQATAHPLAGWPCLDPLVLRRLAVSRHTCIRALPVSGHWSPQVVTHLALEHEHCTHCYLSCVQGKAWPWRLWAPASPHLHNPESGLNALYNGTPALQGMDCSGLQPAAGRAGHSPQQCNLNAGAGPAGAPQPGPKCNGLPL